MLQWFFGSKEEKSEDQLGKDEQWIYDYVRQYLNSPLWRNPLLDFMEEHCHVFEEKEENKFEYTKIFQEFSGLTALLLESMIEEVGISEKTLEKCILKGLKIQKDAKIFKQILICDNFEAFKMNMVTKNKELEILCMRKEQEQSKKESKAEGKQLQIDLKQLERLQIEKAIAMSQAIESKTQEEKQLQEAIKLSQVQYAQEEEKRLKQSQKEEAKPEKKEEIRKTALLGPLPPLSTVKPPRPIKEYKEEQTKLKEEIEEMKKQEQIRRIKEKEDVQNEEIRKKRLLEQRELIRKKKQEQRKEELATFVQTKPTENKLNEEELERRRNLMKRLKEQLKD